MVLKNVFASEQFLLPKRVGNRESGVSQKSVSLNNEIKGHGDVIVSSNVSTKVATHTFLDDHTGSRHLVSSKGAQELIGVLRFL